jgi:hypothetical protein
MRASDRLAALLEARLGHLGRFALEAAAPQVGRGRLLGDFTAAARLVGRAAMVLDAAEVMALASSGIDWLPAATLDELLRVTLLVAAGDACPEGLAELVGECFQRGDNRERRAVLRALPLLAPAPALVTLAIEACRSNVVPVFEAIACDNPFPAAHFPELHFNQLVLKAVFVGLPLERVRGLHRRRNHELARMGADYAAERAAAGRSIPNDLALLRGDA